MNRRQIDLLSMIADRAMINVLPKVKKLDLMMDIEYAHEEVPMDLEKFFAFDNGDFNHDIVGIYQNFNRTTLKMDNLFLPRCSVAEYLVGRNQRAVELAYSEQQKEVKVLPGLTVTEV